MVLRLLKWFKYPYPQWTGTTPNLCGFAAEPVAQIPQSGCDCDYKRAGPDTVRSSRLLHSLFAHLTRVMSDHQYKFNVQMGCGGCSNTIKGALENLPGK
jgi:Copper chaperone